MRPTFVIAFAVCLLSGLLAACENELNSASKISSKEVSPTIETSKGVDMVFSDSALVKARMTAPLMLHHKTDSPYYEMPKGVTVIFFDEQLGEKNRVTAGYAIKKDFENITELRDNVVITTARGDVFKSEQIFWNEQTQKFYSEKLLTRISPNGEIAYANGFESDPNFINPYFPNGFSGHFSLPPSVTDTTVRK